MYVCIYIYVCVYMHQALPTPPPPHGMGPIYCPHMRSSPSPPCGVVGVWYCPSLPPLVVWWGVTYFVLRVYTMLFMHVDMYT